jgi:hypothetical protein
MKLFESHYSKETNEFRLNILPFGRKTLFSFYFSEIDSTLLPKFYFRSIFEINDGSLIWMEFTIGKFIFSMNFLHYKRWFLENYKLTEDT